MESDDSKPDATLSDNSSTALPDPSAAIYPKWIVDADGSSGSLPTGMVEKGSSTADSHLADHQSIGGKYGIAAAAPYALSGSHVTKKETGRAVHFPDREQKKWWYNSRIWRPLTVRYLGIFLIATILSPTFLLYGYSQSPSSSNPDSEEPSISAPADVIAEATGYFTAVWLEAPLVSDNLDPWPSVTNDAPSIGFTVGNHTVTWTATDAAGNSASSTQQVIILDTIAPSITPPPDVFTSTEGKVAFVTIGTPTVSDIADPSPAITNNKPSDGFPIGNNIVVWTATDSAGNSVTAIQLVVVSQVDVVAPAITVPDDITMNATSKLTIIEDVGTPFVLDDIDPFPKVTNDAPADGFPFGTTTVSWTAVDYSGNTAIATQNVIIVKSDTMAPSITPPPNITIESTSALTATSVVSLGSPIVSDNADPSPTVTNNAPAAGFPLGTTTVIWTATDFSDNVSTAVQTVTITLPDTTPPVIVAPIDITTMPVGPLTVFNFLGTPMVTDDREPASITVTNNAPSVFPIGTTTVTWTATDASYNVATATQQVTVTPLDAVPPTVTADPPSGPFSSALVVTLTSNEPATTIYYTTNGNNPTTSSAVYSSPIIILSNTTLKFFAKDSAGNSGEITTQVYALDTSIPTVTASPAGGTYLSAKSVTLTASEAATTIYYTTNGNNPTTSSAVYSSPITIPATTTTLKYFAKDAAGNTGGIVTQIYTIDTADPIVTASPSGGTYSSTQSVTLTSNEPATTIYYTTNGNNPTTSSAVYSSPITIPATTTTLKYFAKDAAGNRGTVVTQTYTIDTVATTVTASPPGGAYLTAQTVTLTASEQSTIYFTRDGTTPTISSSVYTSPISISTTTTLKYFARDAAGNTGAVVTQTYTIDSTAPTVTASPPGGVYTSSQSVTLTSNEPATTIYYTTNGNNPTTSSQVYSSPIPITSTTTLKYFAIDAADNNGVIGSQTYTIDNVAPAVTAEPPGGTYSSAQSVRLSIAEPGIIYYTTNGNNPTTSSPTYSSTIYISSTTTLKYFAKDATGNAGNIVTQVYTIDTSPSIVTANPSGGLYASSQSITLTTNKPSTIYYTKDGSTPTTSSQVYSSPIPITSTTTLKYFAIDAAGNFASVSTQVYTIDTTVPTSAASPAGGTYGTTQLVTLTSSEPGTIYYTTDGNNPTVLSLVYSSPISISSTTTLKYFAKDAAGNTGSIETQVYTIDNGPPTVNASPSGGAYASSQSVTLTASETATIYYTKDGSTPTTSSLVYSSPISITSTTTLRYFAKDAIGNSGTAVTQTYIIDTIAPIVSASPGSGTYTTTKSVKLIASEAATIYYTTDGNNPTISSPVYTSPIPITSTMTLKYFAKDTAGNSGPVATQAYTINLPSTSNTDKWGMPLIYKPVVGGAVVNSKFDDPNRTRSQLTVTSSDPLDPLFKPSGNRDSYTINKATGELVITNNSYKEGRFSYLVEARPVNVEFRFSIKIDDISQTAGGAGFHMEQANTDFETSAYKKSLYGCEGGSSRGMFVRNQDQRTATQQELVNHYAYKDSKGNVRLLSGTTGNLPLGEYITLDYVAYVNPDGSLVQEIYRYDNSQDKFVLVTRSVDQVIGTATAPNGAEVELGTIKASSVGTTASDAIPCDFAEDHPNIIINEGAIGFSIGVDYVKKAEIKNVSITEIDPTTKLLS